MLIRCVHLAVIPEEHELPCPSCGALCVVLVIGWSTAHEVLGIERARLCTAEECETVVATAGWDT